MNAPISRTEGAASIAPVPPCLSHLIGEARWNSWVYSKGKKPPIKTDGNYASTSKPETWATLSDVKKRNPSGGIGLQLLGLKGFCALDLDDVRNKCTGELLPWADELVARCGSYAEVTPSGEGIRILGLVPEDFAGTHTKTNHPDGGHFEVYANLVSGSGRYITVTGQHIANSGTELVDINEIAEELRALSRSVDVPAAQGGDQSQSQSQSQSQTPGRSGDQRPHNVVWASLDERTRTLVSHGKTGDRSADFQSAVYWLKQNGVSFAEALVAFEEHPTGSAEKYIEGDRLERELSRSWEKASKAKPPKRGERPAATGVGFTENPGEDLVAQTFAARYQGSLRFDHDAGRWYGWDAEQGRWTRDNTQLGYHHCRLHVRAVAESIADPDDKITLGKASYVAAVERFAKSDPALSVTQAIWDHDPFLLGCPGSTIDLRTGEQRRPRPEDSITKATSVAPNNSGCPRWLQFLDECTGGDAGLIRFLQQWCGYCLTGDTREHALLFVYGPGGNGKSVFLDTLTRILGDYAQTASMDTFVASNSDKHPTDLAMLRGARLVTASETEEGRAWAESRIKQMTGGDEISARFMRQDFFTFKPQFKLTIVGNHQPALKNVDDAMKRRFNVVPFTRKPKTVDRQLSEKLKAEAPGILAWMIAGCLDWQANGLVRPESVSAATSAYFSEQDLVGTWLEEWCDIDRGNGQLFAKSASLFRSWTGFAEGAGERVGTQKALGSALRRHGLAQTRRTIDGRQERVWIGVRPKPSDPLDFP